MSQSPRIAMAMTDDTWGMVGLTLLSAGLYPLFWLARSGRHLNGLARAKIIPNWSWAAGAVIFGLKGYLVTAGLESGDYGTLLTFYEISNFLNFAYLCLLIFVGFRARKALRRYFQAVGSARSVNPIWTFFLSVIYVNHVMRAAATTQAPPASQNQR